MKIEIMYPELCCLYGDKGNTKFLQQCLPEAEFIYTQLNEKPHFLTEEVDLCCMYSMSEQSQELILSRLMPYQAELNAAFAGGKTAGKIVVAGSSSVTPVMEKLAEAYMAVNPNVEIELQQSDSSSGMTSTLDGVCDIGMASRALKTSELEAGLTPMTIAMDGIAVIVSNDNPAEGLTSDQVRAIYMGEITDWSEVE